MTNLEILNAAAALVCETVSDTASTDYSERAPYILAAFCTQCATVDAKYRKAYGLEEGSAVTAATLLLDDDFPLVSALTPAATYYLAAMLVLDENETLSDKLLDLYTDAVDAVAADVAALAITASLPFVKEKITQVY